MYICIYAFRGFFGFFFQITRVLVTWPNQFLMWCYHNEENNVYVYNWQIHDPHELGVCAVNADHQKQCSLSQVVNSGTTDFLSSLGTNGLIKQKTFPQLTTTTLVKCMKIRNMIGFVIITCHAFSLYSFWVNLLFILWFSFIFHFLKASFVPYSGDKLMVPYMPTREYSWWFLLNRMTWASNTTLKFINGQAQISFISDGKN